MTKHYLNYLTSVMSHQWNDAALTDYNENHEYSFGELAIEMLRLHVLFEQLGIQPGDKIALAGRNCANWAVAYLAIAAYKGVCVSILQDFTASTTFSTTRIARCSLSDPTSGKSCSTRRCRPN